MIKDNKKWHHLAVKKLSSLICKNKTSKHNGDFYCLNCLHASRRENKLKDHENLCKNHDYCYKEIPKKESILKYNHG